MKAKAAILYELQNPLRLEEIVIPELRPGQVLVEIAYSGVCHSQLNEINGLKGEDKFLPHTLGHEGSGVVEAVGPHVSKVAVGDRVVITWIQSSGANVPSVKYGGPDGKVVNSGAVSTFMNRAVISENRLIKLPEGMPMREAALLGCAIPTGMGMVLNTEPDKSIGRVAVFGVGGIGLSAIMAAQYRGVIQIIAVDLNENKLEMASRLGATDLVNCSKQDALQEIICLTGGRGVDLAIESAGKRQTMETAFSSVSNDGGICILAGNLPNGHKIKIDPMDLIRGKRLIGSWGGGSDPDLQIPEYARLYLEGKLNLESLISCEYSLEDINEACADLMEGRVVRALIRTS